VFVSKIRVFHGEGKDVSACIDRNKDNSKKVRWAQRPCGFDCFFSGPLFLGEKRRWGFLIFGLETQVANIYSLFTNCFGGKAYFVGNIDNCDDILLLEEPF